MSFFQFLPANVMLAVAKQTIHYHSSIDSKVDYLKDEDVKELLVLARVCSVWRDVALSLTCRKCVVSANARMLFVNKSYLEYARTLEIHLDYHKTLGQFTVGHPFQHMWQNSLYLPNANTITVIMNGGDEVNALHQFGTASQLAQCIKDMAPRANKVHISHTGCSAINSEEYWFGVSSFISYLSNSSIAVRLSLDGNFRTYGNRLNAIHNLVSLDFEWSENAADMLGILHACSDTLQEIRIHGIDTPEISQIIVGENGSPVVYPYLLNLTLDGEVDMEPSYRPTFENAVPFPRLAKLRAEIIYPFGDDVLFRGNSNSLKELCINLDHQAVDMVNKARVFACGSYKQLINVEVKSFISDIDNTSHQVRQYVNFLQGIAPTVERLLIGDIDIAQGFVDLVPKTKLFRNIHTLCLCDIHLSLADVFDILKALPALQCLESGLAGISPSANGLALENLGQICSKYSLVSEIFSKWKISWGSMMCVGSSALYAVVLASACPRFQTVELPDCHLNEYLELVNDYTQNQRSTKRGEHPISFASKTNYSIELDSDHFHIR